MTGPISRRGSGVHRVSVLILVSAFFAMLPVCERATGDEAGALRAQRPQTDFSKRTVALDEVIAGGPPKDGIPSLDQPRFAGFEVADRWLHSREPVIAFAIGGTARAYPLQILMYHEIVNDTVDGIPVAVTFCPLCNAAIVFDRRVDGRTLSFGTTGRLRKSDLVMYDRQTESWWQQFTGRGIVGHHAGRTLAQLQSQVVAYDEFKSAYPQGQVLTRETGHERPYGRNPCRGYDRIEQNPFLFDDPIDPRLPAMERVLAVTLRDTHRLYPLSVLEPLGVVNDEVRGTPIVAMSGKELLSPLDDELISRSRKIVAAAAFERRLDGRVLSFEVQDGAIRDRESGSRWNVLGQAVSGPLEGRRLVAAPGGVHFAFAWLAFQPDSEIYRGDGANASRR